MKAVSVSRKKTWFVCFVVCIFAFPSFFSICFTFTVKGPFQYLYIYIHRDGSKWKNTEAKGGISVDGITKAATFGTYNTVPGFRQVVGGVGLQKLEI